MSVELVLGLVTLFGTAAIGMPVAYAIIVGVLVYLGLAGQDLAIAGETMVQRLFDGFLLLAVPLFIVSANIMNAGSISDRLLKFCIALVGRFRGGLGHVNVVASLIFFRNVWFGSRRRGGYRKIDHQHDGQERAI